MAGLQNKMGGVLFVLEKVKMTAANIIASFLLMAIERLLEIGYRCPGSIGMRIAYISSFFIIPFGSIILLGYFFQIHVFKMTAKGHIQRFCIFLRSSVPACIWIVILLLDGKYIECVIFPESGNCPEVKDNSCDSTASAISKICGMGLLLAIIVGSCIYAYCNYASSSSIKATSSEESPDPEALALRPNPDSHGRNEDDHGAVQVEIQN